LERSIEKLAYAVDEINEVVPLGRTKTFSEIAAGRLKAHKIGRRTVILAADLHQYLAGLPAAEGSAEEPTS
jgi:excisionase family DNA binding protein